MPDISNGSFPALDWPLSAASGIRTAMERNPAKIAISDNTKSRSYSELVDRMDRITQALISDLGVSPDRTAAILSGNSIEFVEIVAGASQAGVALATINPKLSAREVSAICIDSQASILFVDAEHVELARDCQPSCIERIIEIGREFESWIASVSPVQSPPYVSEQSVFTIPYTSGTTGSAKGVLVSHRSRVLAFYGMAAEYGCYSPDDRFLAIAPLCHGAGLAFALASLYFGGYTRLINKFDPEKVLSLLSKEEITGVFMVPTHFHSIFQLDENTLSSHSARHLCAIISNAAPLPQALKEKIVSHFGSELLHETYGSTEGGIVSNLRPTDQLRKKHCVGMPFNTTLVKLLNSHGEECSTGEIGELFSQSPYVFIGYRNKPEETAAAFQNGWLSVGDMARRDEEGYIYIVDRKKDMIISGGVNIYPREIEDVLLQHPAIAEAGVIGVPNEKWGESIKAFIVTQAGQKMNVDQVIGHCKDQLAKFKIPREISFLDMLPRNASGKLVKSELRNQI